MKKLLSLLMVGLLLNLTAVNYAYAASGSETEKEVKFINKLKEGIIRLGTGEKSVVEVRLKDKTKLKGFIKESNDDGFTVVDKNTGTSTTIPYPQVKQVKGNNLSTGQKILLGVGIGVGVVLILVLVGLNHLD